MDKIASGESSVQLNPSLYFAVELPNGLSDLDKLSLQHPKAQDFLQETGLSVENIKYMLTTDFNVVVGPPQEEVDWNTRVVDGKVEKSVKEEMHIWGNMTIPGVSGLVEVIDKSLHPLPAGYP